jgi:hypothetical protein
LTHILCYLAQVVVLITKRRWVDSDVCACAEAGVELVGAKIGWAGIGLVEVEMADANGEWVGTKNG